MSTDLFVCVLNQRNWLHFIYPAGKTNIGRQKKGEVYILKLKSYLRGWPEGELLQYHLLRAIWGPDTAVTQELRVRLPV